MSWQATSAPVLPGRRTRAPTAAARPKHFAVGLALSLSAVLPLRAQDLTGTYVYTPPQGTVLLELRHSGTRLSGIMRGLDGSMNRLEGTFENGRATGEIQTRTSSGWFTAIPSGAGVRLVIATLDENGEPDLADAWQLDFTRRGAAVAPAASAASPGAAPAASSGTPAATSLVRQWLDHLGGRKVTYLESYASGGSGFSDRWEAYLCTDGTFHFRSGRSVSADVGGVFGNASGSDAFTGRWRIIEQGGRALLQYQRAEQAGTEQGQWIALEHRGGSTFFDGSRVYVTNDNHRCR